MKGQYGYIKVYRKKHGLILAGLAVVFLAIVIATYIHYHTLKTPVSVIPAVLSLPIAKYVVALIVVGKYKAISREAYEKLQTFMSDNTSVMYDLCISTEETIYFIPCMVFRNDEVFAMYGGANQKCDMTQTRSFLEVLLKKTAYVQNVHVYRNEQDLFKALEETPETQPLDWSRFQERISTMCF